MCDIGKIEISVCDPYALFNSHYSDLLIFKYFPLVWLTNYVLMMINVIQPGNTWLA